MPFSDNLNIIDLFACEFRTLWGMYQFEQRGEDIGQGTKAGGRYLFIHHSLLSTHYFCCMKLDLLAIGVHPDDVELGCSGSLIIELKKGKKAGILDLTQGELGSRGDV